MIRSSTSLRSFGTRLRVIGGVNKDSTLELQDEIDFKQIKRFLYILLSN